MTQTHTDSPAVIPQTDTEFFTVELSDGQAAFQKNGQTAITSDAILLLDDCR